MHIRNLIIVEFLIVYIKPQFKKMLKMSTNESMNQLCVVMYLDKQQFEDIY